MLEISWDFNPALFATSVCVSHLAPLRVWSPPECLVYCEAPAAPRKLGQRWRWREHRGREAGQGEQALEREWE